MIEAYLNAARRTKPATPALVDAYCKYYEYIKAHVSPQGGYPELFITLSSERRCELVQLRGKKHLIYDQYLGQSFNRLNRIQFAKHQASTLSMAYASKYVAERLVTLNAIAPATFFGLMSRQLEQNAFEEGDPFNDLGEDEALRHKLIVAQEIFVMAHEVAHHRWALDAAALRTEISEYINHFLSSTERPPEGENTSKPLSSYYRNILDSAGPEFLEEVFADDFGGLTTMRAALSLGIHPWQASLGAILAFKYLRLFRHLEILAHAIAIPDQSGQAAAFQSNIKSLEEDLWDAKTGGIGRFQFREHFLRYRLRTDRRALPDYDDSHEHKIVAVVGDYDEKTEFPATLGLLDRLQNPLTSNLLLEIEKSVGANPNAIYFVDKLTGWQQ